MEKLIDAGYRALLVEGLAQEQIRIESSLDLRYQGQSYTLNVPWGGDLAEVTAAYHRLHEIRYGHAMRELAVELVNIRVQLQGPEPEIPISFVGGEEDGSMASVQLYAIEEEVRVYMRSQLSVGQQIQGPALVTEKISSSFIASGWCCTVHSSGSLVLQRKL